MKKILPFKVRPFNMANFSGGSGTLLYSFPIILLVSFLMDTASIFVYSLISILSSKVLGMIEIRSIEKFLRKVYIPVASVLTALITLAYLGVIAFEFYYFDDFSVILLLTYIFIAWSPFAVNYLAILSALKFAHKKELTVIDDETWFESINGMKFFGLTVAFSVAYAIIAALIVSPFWLWEYF